MGFHDFVGEDLIFGESDVALLRLIRVWGEQIKKPGSVDVLKLEFITGDVGDVHVVGRRAQLFELFAGEDVDSSQVDFGVAVFTSLGGAHIDDFARAAFDDDVTVLTQGRALHRVSSRRSSRGLLEGVVIVLLIVVGHLEHKKRLMSLKERSKNGKPINPEVRLV